MNERKGPWSDKSIVITEKSVLDDLKRQLLESQAREQEWERVLIQYWDQTKSSPSAPEQVLEAIKTTERERDEWKEGNDACSMELQRARKERDAGWAERDALKAKFEGLFKIHRTDGTPCYHDQASGPSCANDDHFRPPTYDDWMELQCMTGQI